MIIYVLARSTYLDLTNNIRVAQVQAIKADVPDQMNVTLTLYNKEGQITSVDKYIVHSDRWMLQARSLTLNLLHLSNYHLTHFGGRDKSGQVNTPTFTEGSSNVIDENGNFNGAEDGFYSLMFNFPQLAKVTDAQVFQPAGPKPNGTTYNVFMSSQGNLYIKASD